MLEPSFLNLLISLARNIGIFLTNYDEQTPTKPAQEFKKCVKKYSNTKMTLYDIMKLDKMSYKQKYMV